MVTYILFPTKVNLENDGDLYSACSNPTIVEFNAVLLARRLSADITHQSTLALLISSTLAIIIPKTITETTLVGFEHAL